MVNKTVTNSKKTPFNGCPLKPAPSTSTASTPTPSSTPTSSPPFTSSSPRLKSSTSTRTPSTSAITPSPPSNPLTSSPPIPTSSDFTLSTPTPTPTPSSTHKPSPPSPASTSTSILTPSTSSPGTPTNSPATPTLAPSTPTPTLAPSTPTPTPSPPSPSVPPDDLSPSIKDHSESVDSNLKFGRLLLDLLPHSINSACAAVWLGSYSGAISYDNDQSVVQWASHGSFYFPLSRTLLTCLMQLTGIKYQVQVIGLCGAIFGYYYGSFGKKGARLMGTLLFGCVAAVTEYIVLFS